MRDRGPIPDSYWVVPGRFLAGEYPGAKREAEASEKVQRICDSGISVFLDLTEDGEYGLRPYDANVAKRYPKAEYRRYAVRDVRIPTAEQMTAILDDIDACLDADRGVYVHCYGGVGRTGTVVGCYLVRHGRSAQEALDLIRTWRRHTTDAWRESPETEEQTDFIRSWGNGA